MAGKKKKQKKNRSVQKSSTKNLTKKRPSSSKVYYRGKELKRNRIKRSRIKAQYEDKHGRIHKVNLIPEPPLTRKQQRKIDRSTGIQMYKYFGSTNFRLTFKDLKKAKRLRKKHLELVEQWKERDKRRGRRDS